MKRKIGLALIVLALGASTALAAGNYNYTPAQQYASQSETLKGRVVSVPSGQVFDAVVTMPLSSATLTLGQTVTLALGSDFCHNGEVIAPAGSSVTGSVVEVSNSKHGSMNGKLLLRFSQIVTPTGMRIPISAIIKTTDGTGCLIGGTKMDVTKAYGKDVAIGAGVGALAGVIIAPLSGGSVGKGTALATAVGAGGGLAKSLWDKGNEVEIPVNSQIELVLTQPITINPTIYNHYY